jgi:ABC-type branched-subunit amino acid transport system permease subunit
MVNTVDEMQGMMKDKGQNRPWGKYIYLPIIMIILFAFPLVRPPLFFLTLFFSVFMYVGLTESWNLLGGYTGYVSLSL